MIESSPPRDLALKTVDLYKQIKKSNLTKIVKSSEVFQINNYEIENYQTVEKIEVFREIKKIWIYPIPQNDGSFKLMIAFKFKITDIENKLPIDINWWNNLSPEWKKEFKKAVNIGNNPTKAEIKKIWELEKLDLSDYLSSDERKKITNLEPIKNLTNLEHLDCDSTQISSLESIKNLTNLKYLYCSYTQIISLEALKNLTNLRDLRCYDTQISSLEPLKNLTSLEYLSCRDTKITSLEALKNLTNLEYLDCRGTKISSSEVEQFKKKHPKCEVVF